ncbi:MAG: AsnC family transcriptional regulator [Candidatus Bathyarchaeia archaeon]
MLLHMKPVERRLISELMKNSRRSDRELAKAIGVSQPTVSRTIAKLEKDDVLREYTVIPDFNKLGYHLCALTFANFETPTDLQAMRKLIEEYGKRLAEIPQAVMIERGLGEGANGVVISLHESYSGYMQFQRWLKQFAHLSKYELHSFIIDLDDKVHYRYLTFSTLAKHMLLDMKEKEE